MKILITGSKGIAYALRKAYMYDHEVNLVSRSTGHNISKIATWAVNYQDYDMFINCATSDYYQTKALEVFANIWHDDESKTIVNIGSKVIDYARTEVDKDYKYFRYRNQKTALQNANNRLANTAKCKLVMINPGPVDTDLIAHLDCAKMDPNRLAHIIKISLEIPEIRRIDLWE